MNRTGRRGFTLPELMIAGALFIALAAMAAFGLKMGLEAQDMSNRVREADIARGDALNRLVDELRAAAPVPVLGLGSSLPSGVLYPDQYAAYVNGVTPPFGNDFYKVGLTGRGAYLVQNRVIFSRPSTPADAATGPSTMSDYVYIEWLVPEQAKNQIWRRVHRINTVSPGHEFTGNPGKWLIKGTYFSGSSEVRGSRPEDWLVARLPGPNDTFEFRVETARYIDPTHNVPAEEGPFNTLHDRNLFKVTMKTTTVARGNAAKKTEREQESQVRVQAGGGSI